MPLFECFENLTPEQRNIIYTSLIHQQAVATEIQKILDRPDMEDNYPRQVELLVRRKLMAGREEIIHELEVMGAEPVNIAQRTNKRLEQAQRQAV